MWQKRLLDKMMLVRETDDETNSLSIEEMYDGGYEGYGTILEQSLNPRSPNTPYEKFHALRPTAESMVLDFGCRNAAQACELHRGFGCRVEGIDLVDSNIPL